MCRLAQLAMPQFLGASDAALEQPGQGTGGLLIHFFPQERVGLVADVLPEVYELWAPGEHKITQLELLMVLMAILSFPEQFRNRRGLWFIDNLAALMAIVNRRC